MSIFRKETPKNTRPELPQWSDHDLQEFDTKIMAYKYEVTLRNGEVVHPIDYKKFHIDQKSMTADGAVILKDDFTTPMYEIVEEKIRQWSMWKGRKSWGLNQRSIDLEKMANEMADAKHLDPGPDHE